MNKEITKFIERHFKKGSNLVMYEGKVYYNPAYSLGMFIATIERLQK